MNKETNLSTIEKKDVKINKDEYITPLVDVIENDNEFILELEMPGIEKNNVDIDVENDILTIKSNKDFAEKECTKCIVQEFALQNYKRSFTLNNSIDVEKINASMENGILTLTLPKSEKLKPRKIEIKTS